MPEGDVVCEAYAGSRRIRLAKADFALGQAVCRWTIQPTATGKRFRAIFEVVASGASAARKFSLPLQTHQR